MKKFSKFMLILMLFLVSPVSAKEINHFTSKVGNDIEVGDTYNASLVTAGETVGFDGIVKGIAFGAGYEVSFNGNADYAVLFGNSVNVKGTVNNDAFIAGNLITVDKNANFKRDAIIGGIDIELNGVFDRNVSIYGSKITFKDVTIKGNVKIYADSISIKKGTVIEGTLYYPEDSSYSASKEAVIGKVVKTEAIKSTDEENFFATITAKIWSFLSLTLIFAVMTLLLPGVFRKIDSKFENMGFNEGVEVFTKGLVIIIIVPVIAVLVCITVIGIPLGIISILLYGIAIYLAKIFTAYLLGYKIWQKVFKKDVHVLLIGILGLFILFLFSLIPGVRLLVTILVVLIGLGLIFDTIKNKA